MAAKRSRRTTSPTRKTRTRSRPRGFGTGLRAQLQRRREGEAPVTTELNAQTGDTPLVRLDLYASPPCGGAGASAAVDEGELDELQRELEGVRAELVQAARRERKLRTALAEQVEAYERRLTEESDVSRQATMLGAGTCGSRRWRPSSWAGTKDHERAARARRRAQAALPAPVRGRRRAVGGPKVARR